MTTSAALHAHWSAKAELIKAQSGIPLDFKRSKVYFARKKQVQHALEPRLSATLRELPGDTAMLYLLSVVVAVVRRHSREDAVSIGCGMDVAGAAEFLPLALDVPTSLSVQDLVEAVRCEQRALATHALGAELLRELLDIAPSQNQHPLFCVAVEDEARPAGELRTDVNLSLKIDVGTATLVARYNPRLLARETMERFLRHIASFLDLALAQPAMPIGVVPYLPADETEQLLTRLAYGRRSAIVPQRLEELFAQQVRRSPDAPALVHRDKVLSYRELDDQANRLACFLRRQYQVADGEAVALCILPSLEMLVGLLAILKAGCAYVPLDPTFPDERLVHQCRIAGARLLLTESALQGTLKNLTLASCRVDEHAAAISAEDPTAPLTDATAQDVAYVMFTSGSTGVPKGIRMPHRPLVNLVHWHQSQHPIEPGERTLQRTSVAFDVSAQEVFSTLVFGGTLVIATAEERDDIASLPQQLVRNGIHRVFLPYVGVEQFAHAMLAQPRCDSVLKEVITAGEQVHVTLPIMRCFNTLGARFVNQYGPTETHVVTSYAFDEVPSGWPPLPPIGRPIDNARVYILGEHLQPVPSGVAGEIWIGGEALARGYAGDDALTMNRFVPNPFVPGERLYRSGDVGRYLTAGDIEFLGRADEQVKVRGYRIEPGEVESTALKHPAIRAAAVVALSDEAVGKRLALYAVIRPGVSVSVAQLRGFLSERLPEHMVPSAQCIAFIDAIPLTATGKLDKRSLPPPARTRPEVSAAFVRSGNDIEARIAGIWSNVLELEEVGMHDSFIELGGHSLLAIRVLTQINGMFGVKLQLNVLLRGNSVSRLATMVAEQLSTEAACALDADADATAGGAKLARYRMPNGQEIFCRVTAEAQHFYEDIFEREIYLRHGIEMRDGDVVVDVGANIGMFVLYALAKVKPARVYAFEPAPELIPVLRSNFAADPVVKLFESALSDRNGEAHFTYYPNATGMSSFYADADEESRLFRKIIANQRERGVAGMDDILQHADEFVRERFRPQHLLCPVRTLSSVIADEGIERIDLLKIDVQKSELDVLRGITTADWPKIGKVVIEAHQLDSRVDVIRALLEREGFTVTVEEDDLYRGSVIRFVYAVRTGE